MSKAAYLYWEETDSHTHSYKKLVVTNGIVGKQYT